MALGREPKRPVPGDGAFPAAEEPDVDGAAAGLPGDPAFRDAKNLCAASCADVADSVGSAAGVTACDVSTDAFLARNEALPELAAFAAPDTLRALGRFRLCLFE